MFNIAMHFEIPVTDMARATAFYRRVFGIEFEVTQIDGNEMALFPLTEGVEGCSGALAKGESYVPSIDGTRIYLAVSEIERVMATAQAAGEAPRALRRAKVIIVLRFILRFLLSLIKRQETERRQGQRPAGRNRMKSTCLF